MTETVNQCFDELAVFTFESSESDQRQALRNINHSLNAVRATPEQKEVICEISAHIRLFGCRLISAKHCRTILDSLLSEIIELETESI